MDSDFINILRKLVDDNGNAALTDTKQCKALLGDYAGSGYKKESGLLLQAVEAGAARAIDGADELEPCKMAQIRDLEEDYGFNQEMAEDIVNALALVLRGDTTLTKSPTAAKAAARAAAKNAAEEKDDAALDEANRLFNSKQFDKAAQLFRKLADAGNARAQLSLGNCYFRGKGVTQDLSVADRQAEAVKWYRKAAEQGNAMAQNNLGYCYEKGEGVPQDKMEAVKWYRKAAEQGHADAQCTLGSHYADGEGVEQDKSKAAYWYEKAAEQGDSTSQIFLGMLYAKGEGVPLDKAKAAYWYTKAADQGDEGGKMKLAELNAKPANTKPDKGGLLGGLFGKKQNKGDSGSVFKKNQGKDDSVGLWEE